MIPKKTLWDLTSPSSFGVYPSTTGGLAIMAVQKPFAVLTGFGGKLPDRRRMPGDPNPWNPPNEPMEETDPVTTPQPITEEGVPAPYRDEPRRDELREETPLPEMSMPKASTMKNVINYGIIGTIIWSILA